MNAEKNIQQKGFQNSRFAPGLILLSVGILLLAYKMGAPIPGWIFSWPVILIVIGLFIGIKSKFHNPGSLIMILIGGIFLAEKFSPGLNFRNFLVPVLLIGMGLIFLLLPKKEGCKSRRRVPDGENMEILPETIFQADKGEYIEVQAVLGGVKRNVQSKNFMGGNILSFMGGSEISFMQADIQQPVILEINNVFGGTKLIIPSNWDIQNNISAVFGGVDDKRIFNNILPDANKKVYLKGSCVFGGLEVTNY